MIKKPALAKAMDEVVTLKMQAMDRIINELVEPLADVGNPEELIKKPYEQWTPEDLTMLIKIYGRQEPNPLSNIIFRKTYERVKQMEEEG